MKKRKVKRKNRYFKGAGKIITDGKFWLISSLPILFIIYNHMRQRKKIRKQRENFYLGVAVYSLFSVVAVVFLVFVFSVNLPPASGVDGQKIAAADAAPRVNSVADNFNRVMSEVESFTRQNISSLAESNNAGDSGSTVDAVDFINVNRALIFYHEQQDKYLAEVVFADNNHQVDIERFILKIKNDSDYSHGVYGAD